MKRFLSILFWAVIPAAFIGPGTVTTCASSGTNFGYSLLWAMLFSTLTCIVLQEASGRLTVVSGHDLAQAIASSMSGSFRKILVPMVLIAVVTGCVAFEAGNILGSSAGISLLFPTVGKTIQVILIGGIAVSILFFGSVQRVSRLMGVIVAVMGVCFLVTAALLRPNLHSLVAGFVPGLPNESGLHLMGLIGTTVVPYNLFLGSGIARGQVLKELRFGLFWAILLGGIISMGIMIVGASIHGSFSYEAISEALSSKLGNWARIFFAVGLFSAGFSSAVTAPLAAALAVRQTMGWNLDSRNIRYRAVWVSVLGIGLLFCILGFQPIPVILAAQAFNGLLLPFIALFLIIVVNDPKLMKNQINGWLSNLGMTIGVLITISLGLMSLFKSANKILSFRDLSQIEFLIYTVSSAVLLSIPVSILIVRKRRLR